MYGLIFLFKWQPESEPEGTIVQDSRIEKIFFAKQVLKLNFISIQFICIYVIKVYFGVGQHCKKYKSQSYFSSSKELTYNESDDNSGSVKNRRLPLSIIET